MKLLLFMCGVVFAVEQLTVLLQENKTQYELPDWHTLWQNTNFSGIRKTRKPKPTLKKQFEKPKMFPNLSTAIHMFEDAKKESLYRVQALNVLKSFEDDCMRDPVEETLEESVSGLRKPYIIVEADFSNLRRHIILRLASRMNAVIVTNPPGCLYAYRTLFPYTNSLRLALLSLGEYTISYNVTVQWQRKPVILTGSWACRTSHLVCKAYCMTELPPPGDEVYIWPRDLLRPDALIFIHNTSQAQNISSTSRWYYRTKQLEWYLKLQGPKVAVVNTTPFDTRESLVAKVISMIKILAANETDVSDITIQKPQPELRKKRTYKPKKQIKTTENKTSQNPTTTAVSNTRQNTRHEEINLHTHELRKTLNSIKFDNHKIR